MNKYKENLDVESGSSGSANPYMPSKDHSVRERQCRLPIKGYNKYQL